MEEAGFREYLQSKSTVTEDIDRVVKRAEFVELFIQGHGIAPREDAIFTEHMRCYDSLFCEMIRDNAAEYADFVAVLRYAIYVENYPLYASVLERIDGIEVMPAIRDELATLRGDGVAEEVFAGIAMPSAGAPPSELVDMTRTVLERMRPYLTSTELHDVLCAVRHALPKDFRSDERARYLECATLDEYIEVSRNSFLKTLERCRDEGTLFYNQPITAAAYDFVKGNEEISGVVRDGRYLYKTKVPYMIDAYLRADTGRKPYYACHCPWARESLNNLDSSGPAISSEFCSCSAGYVVQPFEMALETKLEIETLETALDGDTRCRFRIRIPERFI